MGRGLVGVDSRYNMTYYQIREPGSYELSVSGFIIVMSRFFVYYLSKGREWRLHQVERRTNMAYVIVHYFPAQFGVTQRRKQRLPSILLSSAIAFPVRLARPSRSIRPIGPRTEARRFPLDPHIHVSSEEKRKPPVEEE